MPKTKISEFSATPGNNTDIDGINIAEGCAPSGINDAIRELMAQLKDFQAGTAGDSFNGPVGTSTAAAGAFTTLSSTGNTTLGDASGDAVTINGATTFVNVSPTITPGTANGVAYLNGSKVLTTGSALTFDGGANLSTGGSNAATYNTFNVNNTASNGYSRLLFNIGASGANGIGSIKYAPGIFFAIGTDSDASSTPMTFNLNGSEVARLTSTGLGIGTSSPTTQFVVSNAGALGIEITGSNGSIQAFNRSTSAYGTMNLFANTLYFRTGVSPALNMALDSSGNLGLGVTPSAWGTTKALEFSYGAFSANSSLGTDVSGNCYYNGTNWIYRVTGVALRYNQATAGHSWHVASGTAGNAISFTQALTLDANRNLLLNGTSAGASSVGTFTIFNGTAPTGSVTDGVILFAADVSSSSELRVRDEAGNVTTLSPHNFSLIPEGPSEELAWAYYSEKGGKRINVDMLKLARMVEKLTGEKLVYES